MKRKIFQSFFIIFLILLISSAVFSQGEEFIRPVRVGEQMPDFTLPVYQGGEVTLSKLRGKNVIIIFPRGLAGERHWCHVCNYQYAEISELELKKQIRKLNNVEILFILPYSREMIDDWVEKFTLQMDDLKKWKNPDTPEKLDEKGKKRVELLRKYFPKNYEYEEGKVPLPIPILIDSDRVVSGGLQLFTKEWSGSKIEQNIPAVFIVDEEGILRFKYISQNTFDRPDAEYLLNILSCLTR